MQLRLSAPSRRVLLALSAAALPLSFLHAAPVGAGQVITYEYPEDVVADPEWKVLVNDQEVFVWNNPVAGLAAFEFSGTVEVEIIPKRDVQWVDVRPRSRGIEAKISNGRVRFSLTKPGNFSVELNGDFRRHPLFLFANPVEANLPKAGPGVHFFEAGKVHRAGLIEVKSGDTVYVQGGAVVEGSIVGQSVSNVTIRGRGILDGTNLRGLLQEKKARPHFISLRDCRNVRVDDVILSNGQTWQFVPVNCDGLYVKNLKIVSDNASDDGIDIVRTRDVKIEGSFFRTKDDNIVIKALRDYPRDVTSKNIEVWDSVFWNAAWGNALEIGFELQADNISNVIYRDSDVIHVEHGAVFSIHNADDAVVQNVQYRNIRVENATHKLFDFAIFLSKYSADRPGSKEEQAARYLHGAWDGVLTVPPSEREKHVPHRGKIRDVLIDNVSVVDGVLPFSLAVGFDEAHDIQGVVVKRLTVRGKPLRNAREARFRTEHASVRFR